jgi:hypothetical protein
MVRPTTPAELRGLDVMFADALVSEYGPSQLVLGAPIRGRFSRKLLVSFTLDKEDPRIQRALVGGWGD